MVKQHLRHLVKDFVAYVLSARNTEHDTSLLLKLNASTTTNLQPMKAQASQYDL
jgi:hypothetical protein